MIAMSVVLTALVSAQSGVTGDWEIKLSTQTGITTWQARFEQDGDRLGGEIDRGAIECAALKGTYEEVVLGCASGKFLARVGGGENVIRLPPRHWSAGIGTARLTSKLRVALEYLCISEKTFLCTLRPHRHQKIHLQHKIKFYIFSTYFSYHFGVDF